MKPPSKGDAMFAAGDRRRSQTIGALAALVVVLAMGAITLRAGPIAPGEQPRRPLVRVPNGVAVTPGGPGGAIPPGAILPPIAANCADRFVVVPPAGVDPKMVVKAPLDLDTRMVFDPEAGRRGLVTPPGAPTPPRRGAQPVPSVSGRSTEPGPVRP